MTKQEMFDRVNQMIDDAKTQSPEEAFVTYGMATKLLENIDVAYPPSVDELQRRLAECKKLLKYLTEE